MIGVQRTTWDWLREGIANGWCSEPYCHAHQGIPYTEEELAEAEAEHLDDPWMLLDDTCAYAVRLWDANT